MGLYHIIHSSLFIFLWGMIYLRRTDREITDRKTLLGILRRCDTLRVAMQGEPYPYVVPVSFGVTVEDGMPVVYFHCAREGMKVDLLRRCDRVCVEGDIFIRTEPTDHGITTRYESVIGCGICAFPEDLETVTRGLQAICEHYGYLDYDLKNCRALKHVLVGRIPLTTLTGKRNLPV